MLEKIVNSPLFHAVLAAGTITLSTPTYAEPQNCEKIENTEFCLKPSGAVYDQSGKTVQGTLRIGNTEYCLDESGNFYEKSGDEHEIQRSYILEKDGEYCIDDSGTFLSKSKRKVKDPRIISLLSESSGYRYTHGIVETLFRQRRALLLGEASKQRCANIKKYLGLEAIRIGETGYCVNVEGLPYAEDNGDSIEDMDLLMKIVDSNEYHRSLELALLALKPEKDEQQQRPFYLDNKVEKTPSSQGGYAMAGLILFTGGVVVSVAGIALLSNESENDSTGGVFLTGTGVSSIVAGLVLVGKELK